MATPSQISTAAWNERFGRLLLNRGLISREELGQAWAHTAGRSLDQVLVEAGRLDPARAAVLRAELADGDRATLGPAASTPSHPGGPAPADSRAGSASAIPPPAAGAGHDARVQAARAFDQARKADPLFAPHALTVFRREALLGAGGMGEVYRVEDTRLGRSAAMKVLLESSDHLSGEKVVARFLREARITAHLDHPGIPPIFEAGTTTAGEPYLVMRVIEGETLADAIERYHSEDRPIEGLRAIAEVLVRVTEALSHAHSRRIVHRDLKPENVMLGAHGEVLVMDWGIARELDSVDEDFLRQDSESRASAPAAPSAEANRHLTEAGAVLGTPAFMPPEQAGGEEVDARADVFALGAMLTEALTGEVPVEGATMINRLTALLKGRIRRPRDIDATVPAPLDSLAATALAFEVDDRLQDAATFGAELRRWLRGDPVHCHPESLGERSARLLQRHAGKLISGLVLILLLLVSGGLYASLRQAHQDTKAAKAMAELREQERKNMTDTLAAFSLARNLAEEQYGAELDADGLDRLGALLAKGVASANGSPEALRTAAEIARHARARDKARHWLRQLADAGDPALAKEARIGLAFLALESGTQDEVWKSVLDQASPEGAVGDFKLLRDAVRLRGEGSFNESLRLLDSLIESNLGSGLEVLARSIRSEVRTDLIDVKGALEDARRVVRLAPDIGYFHAILANACLMTGRSEEAADLIKFARQKLPGDPWVRFTRADVFTKRGASLHILSKLTGFEDCPIINAKARRLRLDLLVSTVESTPSANDQRDQARELVRQMRKSESPLDRVHALFCLRRLNLSRGDSTNESALIARACEVSLTTPRDRYDRATRLIKAGRHSEAMVDLEEVVRATPRSAKAKARLAWCRFKCDRPDDALELLDEAERLDNSYALINHYRGHIHARRGDQQAALEQQNLAIKKRQEFAQAYFEKARALIGLGRVEEALQALDESFVSGLVNPYAYLLRARLRLQLGITQPALNDVKFARRLGYGNTRDLKLVEALCYAKLNIPERALQIYDQLLQDNPTNIDALSNRGSLLMAIQRWSDAAKDFRRFIELAPSHPQIEHARRFLKQCEEQLAPAPGTR